MKYTHKYHEANQEDKSFYCPYPVAIENTKEYGKCSPRCCPIFVIDEINDDECKGHCGLIASPPPIDAVSANALMAKHLESSDDYQHPQWAVLGRLLLEWISQDTGLNPSLALASVSQTRLPRLNQILQAIVRDTVADNKKVEKDDA